MGAPRDPGPEDPPADLDRVKMASNEVFEKYEKGLIALPSIHFWLKKHCFPTTPFEAINNQLKIKNLNFRRNFSSINSYDAPLKKE